MVVYDKKTYRLFGENNRGIVVSDGGSIASITLTADSEFISQAVSNPDFFGGSTFNATLTIAAEDWYDDTGLLLDQYRNSVISISITFANGTEENRFTIDSLEDLLAVSDNLSAHYKVTTSIDASSITEPLGVLAGSIVGDNDYAAITGINIASVTAEENELYGGLFTSIAKGAYIKSLTFEGNISLPNLAMSSETGEGDEVTQITYENAYIGLIAGKLDGSLTNVSVELNASNINVYESGKVYVGGLVGYNNGKIKQDFREQDTNEDSSEQDPNEESSDYILYAYTLYMNGTLSVEYQNATVYVGGITGYNNGLIKKVDGTENYTGYTNYMAYSLIDVNLAEGATASKSYVGGIAGYAVSANNEQGILGYSSEGAVYNVDTYSAGKGVIVGGEVSGPSHVGGVVGYLDATSYTEGDIDSFAGITTRTFVRSSSANIGLLTGSLEVNNGIGLLSVFYIQAIDDRRVGEDASMLVVYSDESVSLENYNNLAFGIGGANVGTFNSDQSYFITYIRRTLIEIPEGETSITISDSQDAYYGEAVIVNANDEVTEQEFFETKGETLDLAIKGGITEGDGENEVVVNEMTALTSTVTTKAFYAYYFNAVSAQSEIDNANLSQVQQNLNTYFNTLTSSHKLYPIDVTGEMTLTSLNPNLLDIDQTGQITIKGTGWVQVSGNSILNTNDGISFYIFVTNYFNSNSNVSIIYPNTSQNATALENATISMFANDTAVLYVRPNYEGSISSGDHNLNINADGSALLDGFGFNLATNSDITADIQIGHFSTGDDTESSSSKEEFSTSVAGQTIIITRVLDISCRADNHYNKKSIKHDCKQF